MLLEVEPRSEVAGRIVAGRYVLEEVLGSGGMGAVYGATHRVTGRRVALKRLHPHLAESDAMRSRFLREARAVGALRHPGIVEVLDAGLDSDATPFVVFERLEGRDLSAALQARALSPGALCRIVLDVLEALGAAHAHGFVHRDVKPSNIFLADLPGMPEPRTKLLDFGIVRPLRPDSAPLTEAGAALGTPSFMSPEQLAGAEVDGRADLWAVAVVLYFGLTGRLPFSARNPLGLAAALLRGVDAPSSLEPSLPAEADRVISKALDPRLEARFQTTEEMRSALRVVERTLEAPSGGRFTRGYAWEAAVGDIARETERLTRARAARVAEGTALEASSATSTLVEPPPGRRAWWKRMLG